MPQPLHCHACGRLFPHRRGADLYCSPKCEAQDKAAHGLMQIALHDAGFSQVKEVPNLWLKDGVHISTDEVLREGLAPTLAKHQAVVNDRE